MYCPCIEYSFLLPCIIDHRFRFFIISVRKLIVLDFYAFCFSNVAYPFSWFDIWSIGSLKFWFNFQSRYWMLLPQDLGAFVYKCNNLVFKGKLRYILFTFRDFCEFWGGCCANKFLIGAVCSPLCFTELTSCKCCMFAISFQTLRYLSQTSNS